MKKSVAFGGVTRVPGGAVSNDGDLAAAVDVCNDGAGLEMLEKPDELFTLKNESIEDPETHAVTTYTEELLCIHRPDNESKHYITQMTVTVTTPSLLVGSDDNTEGGEEEETTQPASILVDDDYAAVPANYVEPSVAGSLVEEAFSAWVTAHEEEDSGGTYLLPQAGQQTVPFPTLAGIYLLWRDAEGNVKQQIEITEYGKITATQPMVNTLACNHEGVEDTTPAELRFYFFKKSSDDEGWTPKYIPLGSKPPMINITFGLESTFEYYPRTESTFNSGNTKYKKYGGISIESKPYTDTVPVWWNNSDTDADNYVPPFIEYGDDGLEHWASTYSLDGVESPDGKTDVAGIKVNWTTMALGAYNKFIANQTKDNKFVFPFYVRYAYEMYDGSLIMHSYPVLLIPNSRGPIFALDGKYGLYAKQKYEGETYEKVILRFKGRVYGFSSKLMYDLKKLSQDDLERLGYWKDLIRGINIYVTPPIYNYKQDGQVLGWRCLNPYDPASDLTKAEIDNGMTPWEKYYTIGKVKYTDHTTSPDPTDKSLNGTVSLDSGFSVIIPKGATQQEKIYWPHPVAGSNSVYPVPDYILEIPQKDETDVRDLHEHAGQFFKFSEIEYEKLIAIAGEAQGEAQGEKEVDARKKVLATISNQKAMQDDNGSHDTLSASVLYEYNRRLNMANVSKKMHAPLLPSVQWARDYGSAVNPDRAYPYQVTIYAKNGAEIARLKNTESDVNCQFPQYIFYPNTDAFEALITRGEGQYMKNYRVRLKEHKALNGAFWLADFLNTGRDIANYQLVTNADASLLNLPAVNTIVDESNKIYTTATDNPFYVPFGNINIAGGGEVRALCAATQAMSEGQFGQHPMYTFTSEGVWAMSVGQTGGWATIQPVTRDVITAGTAPLSLDTTVVFLTERGLLQIGGSQVHILSDVLQQRGELTIAIENTQNSVGYWNQWKRINELATATQMLDLYKIAFYLDMTKFPEKARLAYDYDNARIYVTPFEDAELESITDVNGVQAKRGSWVYNIKSGLWTQASAVIDRQVPSYPELETQSNGKVVHISVDRASTANLQPKGFAVTRPIKFGDMGLLKRWTEMVVRGQFKPYQRPIAGAQSVAPVQSAVFGTRNWYEHPLIGSSTSNRWTRRAGSPYFGHSIALFLRNQHYAVQFSGIDVMVDGEHDDKLR